LPGVAKALRAITLAGALAVAVAASSTGTTRTRYRRRPMAATDWQLALLALAAPVAVAALALAGDHTLTWSTTPLHAPRFDPLTGAAVLLLAVPALRRTVRP